MKRRRAQERKTKWDQLIGLQLPNDYRLLRLLGRGPTGAVFEAAQQNAELARLVAIKVMRSPGGEAASQLEATLARLKKLAHPNTVNVIDAGHTELYVYFVMERINGQTFHQLIEREGSIDPRLCLTIGLQVLTALEAAHRLDIVHGNIKPSNVMIIGNGQLANSVKVVDFALDNLPEGGEAAQTPVIRSPEQLCGRPATPASDIFGLAALLYRAITGRSPYRSSSEQELAHEIKKGPPPLLSPRGAFIPSELDGVLRQALLPQADERISATELRRRFVECLSSIDKATREGSNQNTAPKRSPSAIPSGAFGPPKVAWASPTRTSTGNQLRRSGDLASNGRSRSSGRLGSQPAHESRPLGGLPQPESKRRRVIIALVILCLAALGMAGLYLSSALSDSDGSQASGSDHTADRSSTTAQANEPADPGEAATAVPPTPATNAATATGSEDQGEGATKAASTTEDSEASADPQASAATKPSKVRRAPRQRVVRRRVRRRRAPAPQPPPAAPKVEQPVAKGVPSAPPAPAPAVPARPPKSVAPAALRDLEGNPYLR